MTVPGSPKHLESAATCFVGGPDGPWRVERIAGVRGASLPPVERVRIAREAAVPTASTNGWVLRGVVGGDEYVTPAERARLTARSPPLGRREATRAALIPINKSERWWSLDRSERRKIFEETSHHIRTGLEYLPAVARQLYRGRSLGEPFDFLTWFEYAPPDADAFEDLVRRLRASPEWSFVEREVDVRLVRRA